jgi:hypothetical protein
LWRALRFAYVPLTYVNAAIVDSLRGFLLTHSNQRY